MEVRVTDDRAGIGGFTGFRLELDAFRVRFGDIRGMLRHGGLAEVLPLRSRISADLTAEPETTRVVLIDLYVEDRTDHLSGRSTLKVQAGR